MIPQKALCSPPRRERVMRIDADFLKQSSRVRDYALLSLRREGEALVPAAGAVKVADFTGTFTDMFYAGGAVFARRTDNVVARFPDNVSYSFGKNAVLGAAAYAPEHGETEYYLPAADRVYRLYGDTYEMMEQPAGGSCIAVHHERLFLAQGNKLCYSAPLSSEKWRLTEEDTGEIELSPVGGGILALCPFGGRLYVFRENEILAMRADANDLNFSFEKVAFDGLPIANTVQCVGGGIVFRTVRGLYFLTGAACKFVHAPRMATLRAESASWQGKYYSLAEREGEMCIYVYDPAADEAYVLDVPASHVAGGTEGVYFVHGTSVYRLTGGGYPQTEAGGALKATLDAASEAGKKRYLKAVTILGGGAFTAQFEADGIARTVQVKAGEKTRVMQLLRTGVLQFTLRTADAGAFLRTVLLHFEEDTA